MAETYDLPAERFVTSLIYPIVLGQLPLSEEGVEVRELDPPFRIGAGRAWRIPGTRRAVVFGRWMDAGGDEDERLREALRSADLDYDTDTIRSW